MPFASPAPAGPYSTNLAGLNGLIPNGTWALYVYDNSPGDDGNIAAWSLNLTSVSPINGEADLGLSLVQPPVAYATVPFAITMALTNKGPADATGLTVSTLSLGGLTFVGTSFPGSYTLSGGSLTFSPGTIPAGTGTNFTITLVATTNGVYSSTFKTADSQTDLNPADDSAQLSISIHTAPKLSAAVAGGAKTNLVLTLSGDAGLYAIQATTSISHGLVNWVTIGMVTNSSGKITLTDSNIVSQSSRYYRAMLVP